MTLDLSGEGKATDYEIETCARELFERIAEFDSPKDAASSFTLAYWYMIKASFLPEYRKEAQDAVEETCKLLTAFINEGWQ